MAVITISRQLGSLGSRIAHQVAEHLAFCVVWREAINRAARQAGAPEMALAEIDELGLLELTPTPEEQHAYHQALEQVMDDLADRGSCVIIGRAGQVLLRDRRDAFHVKIMASAELRARRVAQVRSIPIEAARAQIETSDRSRRAYLECCFGERWDDPELYDLIINTSRLSPETAAIIICQAFERFLREEPLHILPKGKFGVD